MAAEGITATVRGLPDLREALLGIPTKLRKRALLNALRAGARIVQARSRSETPVIKFPVKGRTPGLVRKAISVRTSKLARRRGDVGVFVNVRPAKAGARGAKTGKDPYYWRWLNFGWNPAGRGTGGFGSAGKRYRRKLNKAGSAKVRQGWHFLEAGGKMLGAALDKFKTTIGPQIQKLNGGKGVQL